MRDTTPAALIEGRMRALEQGDFNLIYETYHRDAPFLRCFHGKSDYLAFAAEQLGKIPLTGWRIIKQRPAGRGKEEVLLWMRVAEGADAQDLFELALVVSSGAGWRYHSAQKLTSDDYTGPSAAIDFHHFDQAVEKIRF